MKLRPSRRQSGGGDQGCHRRWGAAHSQWRRRLRGHGRRWAHLLQEAPGAVSGGRRDPVRAAQEAPGCERL